MCISGTLLVHFQDKAKQRLLFQFRSRKQYTAHLLFKGRQRRFQPIFCCSIQDHQDRTFLRGGTWDEPFWGSKKFVIWVQNIAQHFTRQGPISSVTSIFRPNRKKLCDTECFVFARFARERTV